MAIDSLYKIVKQISEEEFQDIYSNLTANKAEKSAMFLEIIRNSDNPVEEFLQKQDISASAFYVLKSRLNQKIEGYLLNRLGDPNLEATHKVLKIYDMLFSSPFEIADTTLRKLEKTMEEMDNPSGLMMVYRGLKMLHNDDDELRQQYDKAYAQSVAHNLAMEKGIDAVMAFFRTFKKYYLGRKDKDFQELIKIMERIHNLNNLYESKRLYVCKSIIHLYADLFLELPPRVFEIMDPREESFSKCFEILENTKDDLLFSNLNLLFDFLRYVHYNTIGDQEKSAMYFDLLDYKVDNLVKDFNFGVDCTWFLYSKLERTIEAEKIDDLRENLSEYMANMDIDSKDLVRYLNVNFFKAYVCFFAGDYEEIARTLYRTRNEINLRKFPHMSVELKLFLTLAYVLLNEADLANQLILSLQRQLKKQAYADYDHARLFLKLLSNRMGVRSAKRNQAAVKLIEEFNEMNKGTKAILPHLKITNETFGL